MVERNITGPFYHTKYGTVNPLSRLKIKNKVLIPVIIIIVIPTSHKPPSAAEPLDQEI